VRNDGGLRFPGVGAQLETAMASRLHEREGAAITNFERALEPDDAEAVQRVVRDPVVLDFVRLADGAKERDLEAALLGDIERFMLALGEGFYFAGRQKSLEIGGEEFILDLLFFHHPTRRFVVIDLKLGPFKAEFAGKMNLYVNAVDALIAHSEDRATVGFILCAGRNEAVAHLTLQGIATPIAVTRYAVRERRGCRLERLRNRDRRYGPGRFQNWLVVVTVCQGSGRAGGSPLLRTPPAAERTYSPLEVRQSSLWKFYNLPVEIAINFPLRCRFPTSQGSSTASLPPN
jgi:predicted nuclease of restriction endonuclease-like (RecB) superfamily